MGLIYTKIWEIRVILTKRLVNVKMSVKNGVCIREGSPTYYIGPHKVLREKQLGFSKRQINGLIYTKNQGILMIHKMGL